MAAHFRLNPQPSHNIALPSAHTVPCTGKQASRDDHVRALINYVCAPAAGSEGGSMALAGAVAPSRMQAADAGPEIALKRFGLQILRAVIETSPVSYTHLTLPTKS